MGNAPSKSKVQVIKKQPVTTNIPENAHEQENGSTTLTLHEDPLGRLVRAEERAIEAENRVSEASKEVQ